MRMSMIMTTTTTFSMRVTMRMRVRMIVCVVRVSVPVIMLFFRRSGVAHRTAAATAVRVRVSVAEGEDADHVHSKAGHGDDQQAVRVDLRRLEESTDGFVEDEESHDDQKQTVDKTRQHFYATVAVREHARGFPSSHQCGIEADDQRRAIE